MTAFSTFVVIDRRGKYCRFGSYRTVTFTDNPLAATQFTRESDAQARADQDHYGPRHTTGSYPAGNFKVARITLELIEQKPIRKGHR